MQANACYLYWYPRWRKISYSGQQRVQYQHADHKGYRQIPLRTEYDGNQKSDHTQDGNDRDSHCHEVGRDVLFLMKLHV